MVFLSTPIYHALFCIVCTKNFALRSEEKRFWLVRQKSRHGLEITWRPGVDTMVQLMHKYPLLHDVHLNQWDQSADNPFRLDNKIDALLLLLCICHLVLEPTEECTLRQVRNWESLEL